VLVVLVELEVFELLVVFVEFVVFPEFVVFVVEFVLFYVATSETTMNNKISARFAFI
jgi:hypothetical protein